MLIASAEKLELIFKRPAGTSRGVLNTKNSWIIKVWDDTDPQVIGIGEASIIENLSPEWSDEFPKKITEVIENINDFAEAPHIKLRKFQSILFALETALKDLSTGGKQILFPSDFTSGTDGIKINGLIWMGTHEFMLEQIEQKLEEGFSCLKLKIGAIDFDQELDLLSKIRKRYNADQLELRVDANGAFKPDDALDKLKILADFHIHSIEQPIAPKQWNIMAELCQTSPVPIALDEELIGLTEIDEMAQLLDNVHPQYIILKPSLIGGFQMADLWIKLAEERKIGWWITSALESNIGLNAIAQYTYKKNNPMPQGLGTGKLFENNVDTNLIILGERLYHQP
ncbi:MAG: o-succinylbenzoate synthase [Crocinitomicaceae bacterium]|nr:o-succinylbenzoate synthase [Crocinitomicaceae bacterium]